MGLWELMTAFSVIGWQRVCIYHLQHEAICQFPSHHFYGGRLKADESLSKRRIPGRSMEQFWPQGLKSPIVFCNVVGVEGPYIAKTDKGKVDPHSKCNEQEAEKVVSLDQHERKGKVDPHSKCNEQEAEKVVSLDQHEITQAIVVHGMYIHDCGK